MIVFAGAGALGSHIALLSCRTEEDYIIIDDDRVEDVNVYTGTSAYSAHHIGAFKATVLAELVYRKCGARAYAEPHTLTGPLVGHAFRAPYDSPAKLIIDTFDNPAARRWTCGEAVPTLHAGVSEGHTGAAMWDEDYTVPPLGIERGKNPVCTHGLGRNILQVTAALAASIIGIYLDTGEKHNGFVTAGLRCFIA